MSVGILVPGSRNIVPPRGSHPRSIQGKRRGACSARSTKLMWYTVSILICARNSTFVVSQNGFMKKRIVVKHVCMYVCAAMPLNAAMQFVTIRSRHCRFIRNAHRKCGNAASMCIHVAALPRIHNAALPLRAINLRHCRAIENTLGVWRHVAALPRLIRRVRTCAEMQVSPHQNVKRRTWRASCRDAESSSEPRAKAQISGSSAPTC